MKAKHYFLAIILVIALFLRLINVSGTVQFLGDQGRDALIVSKIFSEKDLVFIGPVTSIGNMYLGPLYYYFMVPFLMLTYPSPMGPTYAMSLIGVLTIFLVYKLGKEIVGERPALIAATLMTFSAVVISGTRFSWNPNPAPLISLLLVFSIFRAIKVDTKYWVLASLFFSILIQLHYLTLLSGIGFGIIWIWQFIEKLRAKKTIKKMALHTLVGGLVILLSLTPLALFDLKHDGLNSSAFKKILTSEESFNQESSGVIGKTSDFIIDLNDRSKKIISQISIGNNKILNTSLSYIVIISLLLFLYSNKKNKIDNTGFSIIAVFLITGIIGTALYQHEIFDHYIAYLFPISYLTIGIVGNYLFKKGFLGKAIVAAFLIFFINYNIDAVRLVLTPTGWTIAHIESTAQTIADRVEVGEKYNIILLNGTGDISGRNYEYFLYAMGKPAIEEDAMQEAKKLFIIDEERKYSKFDYPPIYEIVVFPNKEPVEVYEIDGGPIISVLTRN